MSPDEKCRRLARLLDEHAGRLALFAAQWTDSPEDCVQEALIRLAGQAAWPENELAWLYRVVRNGAISQCRSGNRRRAHEAMAAQFRREAVESAETLVDPASLAEALSEIEDELREVLVARIWGRLTLEQIAEIVGVSKSSAFRRYELAIGALRVKLGVLCETNPNHGKRTGTATNSKRC